MAAQKAGKAKELTFACMLLYEDGRAVPFEELTKEEIQRFRENAARRLSHNMSDYYTQHPEEFARL